MPEESAHSLCSTSETELPAIQYSYRDADRLHRAAQRTGAQVLRREGATQRAVAEELDIARRTLRDWEKKGLQMGQGIVPPSIFKCLRDTPEGLEWLKRFAVAAHFSIGRRAGGGVRLVSEFFELIGFSDLIATSYGSQYRMSKEIDEAILAEASWQRQFLAAGMEKRQITACQDETFHGPEVCLVAIEPLSNFIILEGYVADRKAETWTHELQTAMKGLNVEVVQSTSDEGTSLLSHASKGLKAHHSPDLFHLQRDLHKALSLPMQRCEQNAQEYLELRKRRLDDEQRAKERYDQQKHGPGRPPDFAGRIRAAQKLCDSAQAKLTEAQADRNDGQEAIREISQIDHPFDLQTGAIQKPEELGQKMTSIWSRLEAIGQRSNISQNAKKMIAKARNLHLQLVATLVFFFNFMQLRIDELDLPERQRQDFQNRLLPAMYLAQVAERSVCADERKRLNNLIESLLEPLRDPEHPWQCIDRDQRREIEQAAIDCAGMFQRSSSNVEGRNGHLSRYRHSVHCLQRRLPVQTAIHNYFVQRIDGTTAAERFFRKPHQPFFEAFLRRVPLPPQPYRRRSPPPPLEYLEPRSA